MSRDFEEIGHCGGKNIFNVTISEDGSAAYQVGYEFNRPTPMTLFAIYALPEGIPVEIIQLGGIGQSWNSPPFPSCFPVFIASDNLGQFGHDCPNCNGYWRSGPMPNVCPYCATQAPSYQFLSEAQRRYTNHYCETLNEALNSGEAQQVVIDMDSVADAVGKQGEKPAFYESEVSQQQKFTCSSCGEFNDILGRFGHCSLCGTRNDIFDFEINSIPAIREQLNSGSLPEDCIRNAVASFDSFATQIAKALENLIPLTPRRKKRLQNLRFHNIEEVETMFREWFDIDIKKEINDREWQKIVLMLLRRHVYEHNGGEVDQKYLDKSGDTSVRLKQRIHESKQNAHDFLGSLVKMARNLHLGFHEIIPPISEPIEWFSKKLIRRTQREFITSHANSTSGNS